MKPLLSRLALAVALCGPLLCASAADSAPSEQVKRGEYLARAADCMACHTAVGGAPYAGGLPIVSPFGTIYGTNITPDKDYGIGQYSDDEFYAAVTRGKRRDGANLYPAMPYASYHLMPREEVDAIHAYLKTVAPIHRPAPETHLTFPFNVRLGLTGWNLMYGDALQLAPTEGKTSAYQRGQYLVEVLGHCGECHTPRGLSGAMQLDKRLTGGMLNGYLAPNLLAPELAARGWNTDDLSTFLKHGMSAQGSMFNEMFPVFHNSTQGLNDDDLRAMATYLLGDNPPAPHSPAPVAMQQLTASAQRGRQQYLNLCAGCHAPEGDGKPHIAVAMVGNTTLRLEAPDNLLRVIEDGIGEQKFQGFERMQPMPGFADKLNHEQLADLLNYLRQAWGGQPGNLNAGDVERLRADAPATEHKVH
ncbi:cytochrome c [Pseudomonas sp. HR96]|uniref:cytochrome c n=1 Tax=Pseudomonas sp. HR96 TaxID=1027966 RepID=UPI002A749084|nr:cytochrome c [Pseudomonas sp. HR96]WPO97646.1 cytochrome c [Pseudomonas sp. HR96]